MAGLLEKIKSQNEILQGKVDTNTFHDRLYEAITDLNNLGVSLFDYPEATRHRAFLLEQRITEAVNAGDLVIFDQCLVEWRHCFH